MKYLTLVLVLVLMSCKGTKLKDEGYKTDQIQLLMHEKFKPQRIQNGFSSYGLKYLCRLDKETNLVVFSFDTSLVSLKEVILKMDQEVGVISAHETLGCGKQ